MATVALLIVAMAIFRLWAYADELGVLALVNNVTSAALGILGLILFVISR